MIRVTLYRVKHSYLGFRVGGHAGAGPFGQDIVCAAVSSAALLAANTLAAHWDCEALQQGGTLTLRVQTATESTDAILKSFAAHMRALEQQYPRHIKLIYGGKGNAENQYSTLCT